MAYVNSASHGYEKSGVSFWTRLTRAVLSFAERQSRQHLIALLEAKPDAELAEMGIRRDGIVQHVFRDRFYI